MNIMVASILADRLVSYEKLLMRHMSLNGIEPDKKMTTKEFIEKSDIIINKLEYEKKNNMNWLKNAVANVKHSGNKSLGQKFETKAEELISRGARTDEAKNRIKDIAHRVVEDFLSSIDISRFFYELISHIKDRKEISQKEINYKYNIIHRLFETIRMLEKKEETDILFCACSIGNFDSTEILYEKYCDAIIEALESTI